MAQEIITNFPELLDVPIEGDSSFQPTGTTGFAKEFRGDVYTSRGRFGNGSAYIDISATEIKSNNFVSGSLGWRIKYNGDVEFNDGIFRGDITAATGTIGGFTITATTLTGGIIQTSASTNEGVKMTSTSLDIYGEKILFYDTGGTQRGSMIATATPNVFQISGQSGASLRLQAGAGEDIVVLDTVHPFQTDTYDLGSSALKWKDLYLSGSIISGGSGISLEAGEDLVLGNAVYISTGGLSDSKATENTTGAVAVSIYGARWGGQTFQIPTEGTVVKVELKTRTQGTPTGDMAVNIYATDGNGAPTGASLGERIEAADGPSVFGLYTFTLDTQADLDANTTYIIVFKVTTTSSGNRLEWAAENSGDSYAEGSLNYTTDSGSNWSLDTAADFVFNVFTKPRAGRLYKTDASFVDERITGFIGIAGESITAGVNGSIVAAGLVAGASGLTVGAKVYLSDTPGAVSASAGSNSKTVGLAYSATEVIINYSI